MKKKQYDNTNIFAKILRKELPSKIIFENEHVLCFEDISKSAKIHWLVIPKKPYICFDDFINKASKEEIAIFFQSIGKITKEHNIDEYGYRLITNNGSKSGQSVFHFHVHILSGQDLGELHGAISEN
jgi:histidine triad (HIT) family protein